MENKTKKIATVSIFNEEKVEISDIELIVSSTDHEVIAKSEAGYIYISGGNLKILKLLPEGGELSISGDIEGVKFSRKVSKKSLLGKVFK